MAQQSPNFVRENNSGGRQVFQRSQQSAKLTIIRNIKHFKQQTELSQLMGSAGGNATGRELTGSRLLQQVKKTEAVLSETTIIYQQVSKGEEVKHISSNPPKMLGQ